MTPNELNDYTLIQHLEYFCRYYFVFIALGNFVLEKLINNYL